MTVVLACDIGERKTGLALGDTDSGTIVALSTLDVASQDALIESIMQTVTEKKVTTVLLGLPLLPGGQEGAQVSYVRAVGSALEQRGMSVLYLDERYSTSGHTGGSDGDTRAACQLLEIGLQRGLK